MSETRETILIGDGNEARAAMLCEILKREFKQYALVVKNFDELSAVIKKREVQNNKEQEELSNKQREELSNSWRLVLVASDLPLHAFGKVVVMPQHVFSLTVLSPTIKLGCIYDSPQPPNWEMVGNPPYLLVPARALTELERNQIVRLLEQTGWFQRARLLPTIRLAFDPILREQVRTLGLERNLPKGKQALGYLIRNLNLDSAQVMVSKLGQGRSGARVFRFRPRVQGNERRDFVLKLAPKIHRWKLGLEIERYGKAQRSLGTDDYTRNVAKLVVADASKPDGDNARYIVEYGEWNAVCYDFLGGKRFGPVIDFETAIVAAPERLKVHTEHSRQFKLASTTQATVVAARLKLLQTKIDWLVSTWYLKAKREPRVLWETGDRPAKEYPQMPPYQLPGQAKGNILNFLADRDAKIGRHFIVDWDKRMQLVRRFIEWPSDMAVAGLLGRELQVIVSPVHGDLNANNILLWVKEARPFLIDFPWYQDAGHAVQDLASLEFNLKFFLLDRQELDSDWQELKTPKHPLPALDHSPTQLPLWRELEKRLLNDAMLENTKQWQPKRCHSDNAALCWELLRCIRQAAVEVQGKKCGVENPPEFFDEYLPALLFYTVRAIGYDLPLPKRLLAIYSASEILGKLGFVA